MIHKSRRPDSFPVEFTLIRPDGAVIKKRQLRLCTWVPDPDPKDRINVRLFPS